MSSSRFFFIQCLESSHSLKLRALSFETDVTMNVKFNGRDVVVTVTTGICFGR